MRKHSYAKIQTYINLKDAIHELVYNFAHTPGTIDEIKADVALARKDLYAAEKALWAEDWWDNQTDDELRAMLDAPIRVLLDGRLKDVRGPLTMEVRRRTIAEIMGWTDRPYGDVVATLDLLSQGKTVMLTSRPGYCIFRPLADGDDGSCLPVGGETIYDCRGEVIETTTAVGESPQ